MTFCNREDAGRQLAEALQDRALERPLVLAIPRGGVVVGAVLADALDAELDVVLSRKLRAPHEPELTIGGISEDGEVYLNASAEEYLLADEGYLHTERAHQMAEIARRQVMFREVRPRAEVAGRSVIVTDDGIATGSTMIAALQLLRTQSPGELIVAVPLGPPDRLAELAQWCDDLICLLPAEHFITIGQFYEDFAPVDDERAVALLREYGDGPC